MLHCAVVFFVIALLATLVGVSGIAVSAISIAKILFVLFAIVEVASFLFGLIKKTVVAGATPLLALNPSTERNHHDCHHQAIQPDFERAR